MDNAHFDRITIEPGKMNGQPCIRGLRLTVRRVLEALATYPTREALRADYPDLEDEDITRALAFAGAMLADETIDTNSAAHYRRSGTEKRLFSGKADEDGAAYETELRGEVCACIHRLLPSLKPAYAEMLARVDLNEKPVASAAATLGITANNASVRLHRARAALKKQLERSCGTCATHGCLDCRCGAAPAPPQH